MHAYCEINGEFGYIKLIKNLIFIGFEHFCSNSFTCKFLLSTGEVCMKL